MQHRSSITYYYCSSFFAEERRARKKRRRPELKGTHTSFFIYSMNSLRSNSISYLVTQPMIETRYNQKNLHAFQPFRAECRHACRLEFLAVIFLRVMFVIARNAASWLAPSSWRGMGEVSLCAPFSFIICHLAKLRFALLFHLSFIIYHLAKLRFALI